MNQVTHYEPVLDGRTVLVSADDRFVAFERASGARRWETPVGEHAGGSVLTGVATGPIALVTTERGFVASLDGAWMIGDSPAADVGGGHALGLSTGWLNRGRTWDSDEFAPTAVVATCVEAIKTVVAQGLSTAR